MYIEHSSKGTTWTKKKHKYIRKEGNRYIYPSKSVSSFHGGKYIKKNADGSIDRSTNERFGRIGRRSAQKEAKFYREVTKDHIESTKRKDEADKKHIRALQEQQYKALKSADDLYYKSRNESKAMENPKYIKSEFMKARKEWNKLADTTEKELLKETSREARAGKRKIKVARKMINSKMFDKITDMLSRIGSNMVKANNKKYLKELKDKNDKYKATINKNYKEHIDYVKKANKDYKKFSNDSYKDFMKTSKRKK